MTSSPHLPPPSQPPSDPSTPPPEHLQGAIERVTFHSEDSGFSVLRVKVRGQRELVTVVGNAASVTPGEHLECLGVWVNDRQHGRQFRADQLRLIPPSTLEGIERYLGSGLVRGVGPPLRQEARGGLWGSGVRGHRPGTPTAALPRRHRPQAPGAGH